MSDTPSIKKKRWKRWTVGIVLLLCVFATGLWFYAKQKASAQIQTQLASLGLGSTNIGSVEIGTNGVTARDVHFLKDEGDAQPWLKMKTLSIEHSMIGLARGDQIFDAITIDGLEAIIDVDRAGGQAPFEITNVSIPAKSANITNSTLTFKQSGHSELSLELKEATINATQQGYDIGGSIVDPSGSLWDATGSLNPNTNQWNLKLKTESTQLIDDQWQRWPMMSESLRDYLEADATFAADVILKGNHDKPFSYRADIALKQGRLKLPVFDLPIRLENGSVVVADGLVRFQEVVATTDEKDTLNVSGSTTIVGFPVATSFELDFRDVDIGTIDKLASEIPDELTGRFSGSVKGHVDVESNLQTMVALAGTGTSEQAAYAQINSNDASTVVQIDALVLNPDASVQSVAGKLDIAAKANGVSAQSIFESLDLRELASQLEIDVDAAGDFAMNIPLDTANDIATWTMKVEAKSDQGMISQQPLHGIAAQVNLEKGNLKFSQITAHTDVERNEPLQATLDWPLSNNADHVEEGVLTISGQRVPPHWLLGLIDRQIGNASVDEKNPNDKPSLNSSLGNAFDAIRGAVDFDTHFKLPTDAPEKLSRWRVKGKVTNSKVIASDYQLDDFAMSVDLDQGKLIVSDAVGGFTGDGGGQLTGGAQMNLETGEVNDANFKGNRIPLRWLAVVGSKLSPDFQSFMEANGLDASASKDELDGNLSMRFDLLDPARANSDRWAFATQVDAKELKVKGNVLRNLRIKGQVDADHIVVSDSQVDLPNQGKVQLNGDWGIANRSGNANLKWQRVSIETLSSLGISGIADVGGTTSGTLDFGHRWQPNAVAANLEVNGSVALDDLEVSGIRSRRIGFDLRTENGELRLENFFNEGGVDGIKAFGHMSLAEPFTFKFDAALDKIPLSQVMAQPSVAERLGDTLSIFGVANGKFELEGELQPLRWRTSGEFSLSDLGVNGKKLNDITALWNYDPTNVDNTSLSIQAFGGEAKLAEFAEETGRVMIQLKDIDASQLTSIAQLPFRLKGTISGDASVNQWGTGQATWADFHLKGLSATMGGTEVGDLAANVEIRNSQAEYSLEGRLLNGLIVGEGKTTLDVKRFSESEFPLSVRFTNGSLDNLYKSSNRLSKLRPLQGKLSAKADVVLSATQPPTAKGLIQINDLTWNNERLTRVVSSSASLNNGILRLDKLRADLNQGELSGRASIPISGNGTGTYQLDVRQFDLQRFLEIVMTDPIDGVGLMDARVSGKIGRTINGQGSLAINKAELLGLEGRTLNVPIRFQFEPGRQTGKLEIRESKFQMFHGNVAGHATIEFGRALNLDLDFQVSKLDTEPLFADLLGFENAGQGDLSGRLIVKGKSIRSIRDLNGSFNGELDRVKALQLPLLQTLSRFFGGNSLQSQDFESNDIDVRLTKGKLALKRLNFNNALAQIAITGNIFADGRLDLDVAAQVNQLNQPTLIDRIAGSPLARLSGSPAAFFTQAANFLSERLVFVKVGGTIQRPQVRADAGKQLTTETIRYFLRGSQILPNSDSSDN